MSQSILDSTKKSLGVPTDYDVFDPDIIMHINTVMSTLYQLGVGPTTPFTIDDNSETWEQFLAEDTSVLAMVRSYVYIRVKLLFDPPTTSFAIDALKKTAEEYEWRLNVQAEGVNHANQLERTGTLPLRH